MHRHPADAHLVGAGVELDASHGEHAAPHRVPGERRLHERQQLGHAVRPRHAGRGPGRERLYGLLGVPLAHAEQDRYGPRQPYGADELHRPYDGQGRADEHHVRP